MKVVRSHREPLVGVFGMPEVERVEQLCGEPLQAQPQPQPPTTTLGAGCDAGFMLLLARRVSPIDRWKVVYYCYVPKQNNFRACVEII